MSACYLGRGTSGGYRVKYRPIAIRTCVPTFGNLYHLKLAFQVIKTGYLEFITYITTYNNI